MCVIIFICMYIYVFVCAYICIYKPIYFTIVKYFEFILSIIDMHTIQWATPPLHEAKINKYDPL